MTHVPDIERRIEVAGIPTLIVHPGLDHFGVCSDERVVGDCLAFLAA